jgi:hypothetical protein
MKARWPKAVLLVLVISLLTISLTTWLLPREPVYQGKPLSYWFEQARRGNDVYYDGEAALRQIGTNGIPFLLKKAKMKNGLSPLQNQYRRAWLNLPPQAQRILPSPKREDPGLQGDLASALGIRRSQAVAILRAQFEKHNREAKLVTILAIEKMGIPHDSLSFLADVLRDRDGEVAMAAAQVLLLREGDGPAKNLIRLARNRRPDQHAWFILTDDNAPGLTNLVQDAGMMVRATGNIGEVIDRPGTVTRIPTGTLARLLKNSDPSVRVGASLALWRVHRSTEGISVLIQQLNSGADAKMCAKVFNLLGEMGPAASQAVSAIEARLGSSPIRLPDSVRRVGRGALRKIDPEAAAKLESAPQL